MSKLFLIDEAELVNFQLFGVAAAYSDTAYLVYHTNSNFETRFERCRDIDVWVNDQKTYYPVYEWEDERTGILYHLIKNLSYNLNTAEPANDLISLFDITPVLIPEFKEYNYLLKITGDETIELPIFENSFIQKITSLSLERIKTVDRLIF